MKFLIAIAFVAIVVAVNAAGIDIPEAQKEKAKQYIAECRTEIVVSDEEVAKLKAGEKIEPSENAKCLANCFQEKAGILKDGVFQADAVLAKFSPIIGEEKTKAVIEACKGESGNGKCDTAYKLHSCFHANKAY